MRDSNCVPERMRCEQILLGLATGSTQWEIYVEKYVIKVVFVCVCECKCNKNAQILFEVLGNEKCVLARFYFPFPTLIVVVVVFMVIVSVVVSASV